MPRPGTTGAGGTAGSAADLSAQFGRLLDPILDGLVGAVSGG
ncbi:MAG TPA: hypothetical protein VK280_19390 [Streptosporangiaceae bacterium]|nr:hypothetical protein [Streptosporangiaceae bacterium]